MSWKKAEKEFHESEIFEADNSYQLREKMEQYLERMLEFFENRFSCRLFKQASQIIRR